MAATTMARHKIQREASLFLPEVQNPFELHLRLTWVDKIQILLMTLTIVPIKILLVGLMLTTAWGIATIALWGRSKEDQKQPMSGWRNWLRPVVVFFCRGVFFVGGFHWITTKGRLASSEEAPVLALSPHSSFFDALPIVFLNLTSVVAKSEVENVPIFGRTGVSHGRAGGAITGLGRAVFFVMGFYRIKIKGTRAPAEEAPILVCAPHSSMFDVFIFFLLGLPSGVSRQENLQVPIVGTLTRYTQPVFVSREDPNSRQNTIKEIKNRAQSAGKWPQIAIFPEGTCTNRSCLISFKPGAFYPGVAVQPVCIRYANRLDSITWTWEGLNAFQCLWYSMCQLNLKTEIEFLPVYKPSPEEIEDPKLFASNVRTVMAKAMNVPMTDHTYEDIRLMKYAATLNLPNASGLVEFSKLNKKLGVSFSSLKDLLERFGGMAQSCDGLIDLETFAKYLDLPVSQPLREVFELYDRDGSGKLDFREYVIGLSLIAMPANSDSTITLAFKLFDHGDKGYIEEEELRDILTTAFGQSDMDAHKLFISVDADKDGRITYEEFKNFADQKPEYASIFCRYQEIHSNENSLQTLLQCPDGQENHHDLENDVKVNNVNDKVKSE